MNQEVNDWFEVRLCCSKYTYCVISVVSVLPEKRWGCSHKHIYIFLLHLSLQELHTCNRLAPAEAALGRLFRTSVRNVTKVTQPPLQCRVNATYNLNVYWIDGPMKRLFLSNQFVVIYERHLSYKQATYATLS